MFQFLKDRGFFNIDFSKKGLLLAKKDFFQNTYFKESKARTWRLKRYQSNKLL